MTKTAIFCTPLAKMNNYDFTDPCYRQVKLIALTSSEDYSAFKNEFGGVFSDILCCSAHLPDEVDFETARQKISRLVHVSPFTRIISQSEDSLLIAARLRDFFKIPGMSYEQTMRFRNKIIMKDIVSRHGIRVPRYKKIIFKPGLDEERLFHEICAEIGSHFVIKPTALLGSMDVTVVQSLGDFRRFMQQLISETEYDVEEFISGTLFHCDCIVQNKKILFKVCSQYSSPNVNFKSGKSVISIPLLPHSPITQILTMFNQSVLTALEFETGISHHEIFINEKNEPVFLEIAARRPGVVTPAYRKAFHVAFEDIEFKMQMELPFQIKPTYKFHYLSGIFPILTGTVSALLEPQLKSPYKMQWFVKPGDHVIASNNLRGRAATIEAWNEDREVLLQDFEYLKDYQCISVVQDRPRLF